MQKRSKWMYVLSILSWLGFGALTALLVTYDRQAIGPQGSVVGLAGLNQKVFALLGENQWWYEITEYLGYLAFIAVGGVALLILCQCISRKSLRLVDRDLYITAFFWAAMGACYLLFEKVIINYRPVLEEGELAASFPSSHTMLVLCVMWATALLLGRRIRPISIRVAAVTVCILIMLVTAVGRLLCGVHWFTDILGGVLLGSGLSCWYTGLVLGAAHKGKHNA